MACLPAGGAGVQTSQVSISTVDFNWQTLLRRVVLELIKVADLIFMYAEKESHSVVIPVQQSFRTTSDMQEIAVTAQRPVIIIMFSSR